ncbi:GTPase ObgE [Rhodohalobacter sp. SW132]|uniref:GTPase ObgE n=1 Tax=Rhodohalobacter sp. SW132 TaxID=2293433 RepID=UPI000E275F4C|nr:GTPase ObgE [Rhodohalobacter sp. SW132]REL37821.1 GTPase ObgE [Rhodohalobacter sp. SW132]
MRFADYAKIYVTAGNGGSGMSHFRREKYVPKGGPDGGDGGRGGSVILIGNVQLNTLLDLRYRKYVKADHGKDGHTSRKTGKDGKNEILEVPLGTVVYDADTKERLGEITEDEQKLVVAEGGQGGLGNWHFKSSTNQSPTHAQEGKPGEERAIELELKLIADVGLVGFPNAGKSTLLSALSEARPKVADYPFTTLEPNLGVVTFSDYRSFVMADIPGIIEDAHEGKGLGIQFLRHIERNNLLLFMVGCDEDINEQYNALLHELREYRGDLLDKPRILAITKLDLVEGFELEEPVQLDDDEVEIIEISSATGHNIDELKEKIWEKLQTIGDHEPS